MRGHLRERSPGHWAIVIDVRDPATGKRNANGTRSRARNARRRSNAPALIASVGQGSYVEPSKMTVADFVRVAVDQWEAAGNITARTAQRYRQLVENQIVPHLGAKTLQKLEPPRHRGMAHDACATAGWRPHDRPCHACSARRCGDAERDGLVMKNVCKLQKAPKVADSEMAIVQDVPGFVAKLARRAALRPRHGGAVHRHALGRGAGAALEPRRSRRQA